MFLCSFQVCFPTPPTYFYYFNKKINRFTGYTANAVNKHKCSPSHAVYKLWHTASILLQILIICLKCMDVDISTLSIDPASQFCVGNGQQLLIKNKTGQEVYLQGVVCEKKNFQPNGLSVSDIYLNSGRFLPLRVILLFNNLANSVPVTLASTQGQATSMLACSILYISPA